MSVNVEFVPEGLHGIVAEGTYLWDAAKRLGVHLPAECAGRGECDGCAVTVREGAALLSELTNAERERLQPERLAAGERLACQVKVVQAGTLKLEAVPVEEREETVEETKTELREEFRNMPLQQKLVTLVELEAITAYQTFKSISDLSSSVFEKGVDVIAGFGRARERRARASHRPAEHRASNAEGEQS
ncbi:MAG: (2Fe-2S)-binding protein [Pyrinomonadaceae bacterium]|nr:(2Fe-2S)-binding protein [Pyrinomonadaceae bacterium]